ncbi:MAG: ornithine carbamoyltransferase [Armatimonadetes bacterium]|nr:ornithine carbamoyltransferase [Armatimonadota bacterium]
MWQRFTEKAKRAIFCAQEEAGRFGENYVSTEHLLLALVKDNDNRAVRVLDRLGVSAGRVRSEIERQVSRGDGRLGQDVQLTPRAKRVIDLAYDEARQLNNNYIGTEHLLLGLIREGEGLAGRVLAKLGVDLDRARKGIISLEEGEASMRTFGTRTSSPPQRMVDLETVVKELETANTLASRDIVSVSDLSREDIDLIFSVTRYLKHTGENNRVAHRRILPGKTLAMIFEKPSLRTRVTFEVGMTHLGGHAIYLGPNDIQLGQRESVKDAGSNLARWVDVIMARVFAHSTVTELAESASIPVINGLSDLEHPCQALADFYTILEHKGQLKGLRLAFIGDGNNVANSLMLLAAKMGTDFVIACPEGFDPTADIVDSANELAKQTGSKIEIVRDPFEAAEGADVLYTDVWASMGQENEREIRKNIFATYQVNQKLLDAAKPDAIVEHCLPAHRGEEITDEVIDGPQSVVLDEAENRLHVQKAILALIA